MEERVRRLEDGGRGEEEEKGEDGIWRRRLKSGVNMGKKEERDGERQEEGEECEEYDWGDF